LLKHDSAGNCSPEAYLIKNWRGRLKYPICKVENFLAGNEIPVLYQGSNQWLNIQPQLIKARPAPGL
jgi:hypothetical protein